MSSSPQINARVRSLYGLGVRYTHADGRQYLITLATGGGDSTHRTHQ